MHAAGGSGAAAERSDCASSPLVLTLPTGRDVQSHLLRAGAGFPP